MVQFIKRDDGMLTVYTEYGHIGVILPQHKQKAEQILADEPHGKNFYERLYKACR